MRECHTALAQTTQLNYKGLESKDRKDRDGRNMTVPLQTCLVKMQKKQFTDDCKKCELECDM